MRYSRIDRKRASVPEHRVVIAALWHRDPALAEKAFRAHLDRVHDRLFRNRRLP